MRIAVVVGARGNFGGKDFVADDMDAIVRAGDILLELGRAPANVIEPLGASRRELGDDAAHPADRFVDDRSVLVPKRAGGLGIGCEKGIGNLEAMPLDQAQSAALIADLFILRPVAALLIRWRIP